MALIELANISRADSSPFADFTVEREMNSMQEFVTILDISSTDEGGVCPCGLAFVLRK